MATTRRAGGRERGVALLLVLWVFMTLGVIALDFAQYMRDDATATLNVSEETRAYFVAVAGLNRALFEVLEDAKRDKSNVQATVPEGFPVAPPDGMWHEGKFGDSKFRVRISYESGRIPINCGLEDGDVTARRTMLTAVVTNLLLGGNRTRGVGNKERKEVAQIVDAILDWTDLDDNHEVHGAENDYYTKLDPPYEASNNLLTSPEELLGVRYMTADLLYGAPGQPGLRDVITVHRVEDDDGECQVEGRYVTAPVLQALGVEAEIAEELVAERDSAARYNDDDPDEIEVKIGAAISPDLGPGFLRWDGADGSMIMSIESEADLEQPRNRAHIRAVLEADLASATSLDEIVLKEWNDRAPWTSESPAEGLVAGAGGDA